MKIICGKVFLPSWVSNENFVFKFIGLVITDFVVIFKPFVVLDKYYNHAMHEICTQTSEIKKMVYLLYVFVKIFHALYFSHYMHVLKHRHASMKNTARGGVSRDTPRVLYFSDRQA